MTTKTEAKHTPALWKATRRRADEWKITAGREYIASVFATMAEDKTFEYNAILIAAAPELLEACQYTLDQLENTCATLCKAIAKAKSGENEGGI
jgi:hypothetical protein